MIDLTILTCNYNTPDLILNLLASISKTCVEVPRFLVINTSKTGECIELKSNDIEHIDYFGGTHGEAVNIGLKHITTRYVLLVDSDVLFLRDFSPVFDRFKKDGLSIMGRIVGNVGEKKLHPRIEPWYCFIDLDFVKKHDIKFFDGNRTLTSKSENKIYGSPVYDVGSTMLEDIIKFGGVVGDVSLEGKYFKHYGGMSWRIQNYDPKNIDTDIDFGGTHPHRILHDIGIKVKVEYESDVEKLKLR